MAANAFGNLQPTVLLNRVQAPDGRPALCSSLSVALLSQLDAHSLQLLISSLSDCLQNKTLSNSSVDEVVSASTHQPSRSDRSRVEGIPNQPMCQNSLEYDNSRDLEGDDGEWEDYDEERDGEYEDQMSDDPDGQPPMPSPVPPNLCRRTVTTGNTSSPRWPRRAPTTPACWPRPRRWATPSGTRRPTSRATTPPPRRPSWPVWPSGARCRAATSTARGSPRIGADRHRLRRPARLRDQAPGGGRAVDGGADGLSVRVHPAMVPAAHPLAVGP